MTAAGPGGARGPRGDELAEALAADAFSGVALVLGPDGLVAEVAAGIADRATDRPIAPSSRFGTASASKLFTAVALVRLFERGTAAPAMRLVDVLAPDRRPRALDPGVTLEHLLTHTSGMADYFDEYGEEPFEALWATVDPLAMRRPADLLPLFADLAPLAAPGAQVRYCNAGFILAGLALEAITGRDFYDVITDEILVPAGLADTGYPALDEPIPELAVGYLAPAADDPGPGAATNARAIPVRGQPDGGAFTTAADLVRFLDAVRDGVLLGGQWREEALRPRVRDEAEDAWYGLGWWTSGTGRGRRIGHPGGDPGYQARLRWYPETGHRVAILVNASSGGGAAARIIEERLVLPA
jgi:CubicO group peptidase (beta-lactamase class C family)